MKGKKDSLNIYIDGYHIIVDRYNWSLYSVHESKDKDGNLTGETYDREQGHFHTLGQLLHEYTKLEIIKNGDVESLEKLLSFYGATMLEVRDRLVLQEKALSLAMEVNKAPLVNESIMD